MKGWENISSIEKLKARGMVVNCGPIISSAPILKKVRKEMKHDESDLQIRCVETFRLIYPKIKMRLFSIPNGSYRTAFTASILCAEGCTPGVCDVFLAVPKKQYGGMFIEFKSESGRLSEYQVQFIKEVSDNYYCAVIRTVEEFLKEVNEYLNQ